MSKIYLGAISTLLFILGIGFWQYSSAIESLGEFEQANRQLESSVRSMEERQQHLNLQYHKASDVSLQHHEKALQIINAEMLSKERLLQYKIKQLRQQLSKQKNNAVQLKSSMVFTNKESTNKEKVDEKETDNCAESYIPEFYLKQL
jgi:predicted house-cleaning NTP pyrophosphatase (Maf/HAM1 superfamily)